MPGRHHPAFFDGIDPKSSDAVEACNAGGKLPDRSQSQDKHGVARLDTCVCDPLRGGGQDVTEEEESGIREILADDDRIGVSMPDTKILSLPAGHLTVELRVAIECRARTMLGDLQGLALRLQTPGAHPAAAARDRERDHDPLPRAQPCHFCTDLLYDAHRLVAEDVTTIHERSQQLVEVQV